MGAAHEAQSGLSMSSCPQVGQMNGIMRFPSSRGPTPAYFDVGALLPRPVVPETLSAGGYPKLFRKRRIPAIHRS